MRRFKQGLSILVVATAVAAALGPSGGASTGRATSVADHRGGTLKLLAKSAAGTIDPMVNYTLAYWQLYQATYDGLLAFKKAGANEAFTVVPDIAQSIPTPTNGGKRWVFKIRKGIKFSNGKTVKPSDVAASYRRIFKVKSPTSGTFYAGIVGAKACLAHPAGCTLKGGVIANDKAGTVTINLTAPDPEFKYRVAVPHASILPASTPPRDTGTKPIPGTGSYYFASYDPNKQLVLKRNPYFKQWSAAAQPDGYADEITESFGLTDEAEVTEIENGQADWMLEQPPADRLNEIGTKYASQVHIFPLDGVLVPPHEHEPGAVQQPQGTAGIELRGRPERRREDLRRPEPGHTVLPGAAVRLPRPQGLLPVHEEPGRALVGAGPREGEGARQGVRNRGSEGDRRLVRRRGQQGRWPSTSRACSTRSATRRRSSRSRRTSRSRTRRTRRTRSRSTSSSGTRTTRPRPTSSTSSSAASRSIQAATRASTWPASATRRSTRRCTRRSSVAVTNEQRANAMWSQIDRMVTDEAPMVTLFNPKHVDFVSKRVGNFTFSKEFYWLVAKSWVQ